jgi:hypothetical protein
VRDHARDDPAGAGTRRPHAGMRRAGAIRP